MIGTEQKRKLPTGWKWVRLGDIIDEIQSGFACGEREPKGVIQLRMNNVDTCGNFIWDEYIRVPADKEVVEQYRLIESDVVFNNTNSTELVGKSALFSGFIEPVVYSNHFTRIRTNQLLLPSILSFWLNYQWIKGVFSNICNRWIGQSAVKPNKLLSLDFPLPPLPEQKRIAGILTEQIAAAQKTKRACQEKLEAAEKLPASYLNAIFNSEKAKQWPKKKLGEVCEFVGGMQPPKYTFKYEKKPNHVRLVQIQDFRISDAKVYIPEEHAKRTFNEDDVMIGRYGPPVFQILRGLSGAYNVALMKTVPKNGLLKDYLYFLLQETNIQRAVIGQSQRSAGQSGVQKSFLENYEVCLPEETEQERIAGILTEQMVAAAKVKKAIEEELDLINKLPASLLQQAFKGKL